MNPYQKLLKHLTIMSHPCYLVSSFFPTFITSLRLRLILSFRMHIIIIRPIRSMDTIGLAYVWQGQKEPAMMVHKYSLTLNLKDLYVKTSGQIQPAPPPLLQEQGF